jgi:hypothetical protein
VVKHLEVRWSHATLIGGVDWKEAYQAAVALFPVDASHRDQFWMPPTPEGPVELTGHMYESEELDTASFNLGRVLVRFQRVYAQRNPGSIAAPIVPAVTLTKAEIGQSGTASQ